MRTRKKKIQKLRGRKKKSEEQKEIGIENKKKEKTET